MQIGWKTALLKHSTAELPSKDVPLVLCSVIYCLFSCSFDIYHAPTLCQVPWLVRKWGTAMSTDMGHLRLMQWQNPIKSHCKPNGALSIHLLTHSSFILQIFIEHLLCATPCPRCWGCGTEQARLGPCLSDAYLLAGTRETANKHKHTNSHQRPQRKGKQTRSQGVKPVTAFYGEAAKRESPDPRSGPGGLCSPCWNTAHPTKRPHMEGFWKSLCSARDRKRYSIVLFSCLPRHARG